MDYANIKFAFLDTALEAGLYFIPANEHAANVLAGVFNQRYRGQADLALLGRPKRRYDCLRVTMDDIQSDRRFTVGSRDTADIRLPLPPGDGEFVVLFEYAIIDEDGLEEPRLYAMALSHGRAEVNLCDNMTSKATEMEVLSTERRCLSDMTHFSVGDYDFDVHQTVMSSEHRTALRVTAPRLQEKSCSADWRVLPVKEMGMGASATVALVRGKRTGTLAACKVIPAPLTNLKQRQKVQREINNLKKMHHRHIIPYLDHEGQLEDQTDIFRLMMWPAHGTLRDILSHVSDTPKGKPKVWHHIKTMIVQVTSALAYMHASGIVHRDVKPENVLFKIPGVGERGLLSRDRKTELWHALAEPELIYYLADVGVSRHIQSMNGTFAGTPAYMAPEISTREEQYTTAVDIFSFGILIAQSLGIGDLDSYFAGLTDNYASTMWEVKITSYREALQKEVIDRIHEKKIWLAVVKMMADDPATRPRAEDLLQIFETMWPKLSRRSMERVADYASASHTCCTSPLQPSCDLEPLCGPSPRSSPSDQYHVLATVLEERSQTRPSALVADSPEAMLGRSPQSTNLATNCSPLHLSPATPESSNGPKTPPDSRPIDSHHIFTMKPGKQPPEEGRSSLHCSDLQPPPEWAEDSGMLQVTSPGDLPRWSEWHPYPEVDTRLAWLAENAPIVIPPPAPSGNSTHSRIARLLGMKHIDTSNPAGKRKVSGDSNTPLSSAAKLRNLFLRTKATLEQT